MLVEIHDVGKTMMSLRRNYRLKL